VARGERMTVWDFRAEAEEVECVECRRARTQATETRPAARRGRWWL